MSYNAFNRNQPTPFTSKLARKLEESPTSPRLEKSEGAVLKFQMHIIVMMSNGRLINVLLKKCSVCQKFYGMQSLRKSEIFPEHEHAAWPSDLLHALMYTSKNWAEIAFLCILHPASFLDQLYINHF